MASVHIYVDTRDRQWANPPNMKGLYHAHVDVSELGLTDAEIEAVGQHLTHTLLQSIREAENDQTNDPNINPVYEVYDNADGGLRKAGG